MSAIDERVVNLKFNNQEFEARTKTTLNSLTSLNKGLKLEGAAKGLNNITTAANNVNLKNISNGVSKIASQFRLLRSAALIAFATIVRQATYSAEHILASFTIDPIKAGFENYETQINAIRTILSNTGLKGKEGLAQVNGVLKQLNVYANQTVYNFSEMAKNIGTFTAAGVKLKPAANAIKGIANLAALSGANSGQASSAMYQLSQALAANQVKLQDWNSVVNAGIGGKVFQNALFQTGVALNRIKGAKVGETLQEWTSKGNTFRQSLKSGWVNAQVLTNTLEGFTGDLTKSQLKAKGYTAEQIKQIQTMGTTAVNAATKIKTFSQLTEALKEEVATAYAAIFKTLLGNINQATALFSRIHIAVENALTKPIYAFNKVLEGWAKLGGRSDLLKGLLDGLHALESIMKPIKEAFREIFPPETAQGLLKLTKSFVAFMNYFKIGAKTADNLKRTFAGLFAVLDIGWQVVKAGTKFILDLFKSVTSGEGSGGFLGATAHIGDFLVALDKAIKKGKGLTDFFNGLERVLQGPINLLKAVASAILGVFNFKPPSSGGIENSLDPISKFGQGLLIVWNKIIVVLEAVWHVFEPLAKKLGTLLGGIGKQIQSALSVKNFNFTDFLHTIDTGLLGGLVLTIKKFVGKFTGEEGPIGSITGAIREPFEELTGTMKQMQKTLQASTLLEIASAIGIMTISVIKLSQVNPAALTRSLGAMTVMFGQLLASLAGFSRIGGPEGLIRIGAGLVVLSGAIRVLTGAVVKLGKINGKDLAKGLAGVAALLVSLGGVTQIMSTESAGMIASGIGLTALAVGIRILVKAVTKLSGLSWDEMSKGLTGVATLLLALSLYSNLNEEDAGGVLAGAGIILLATGIRILAKAITNIGKLSWSTIAKGLTGLAGSLIAIAAALTLMPASTVLSAAAVLIVATSLGMIGKALTEMGKQSWGSIAKGLVSLAGALVLIGAAVSLIPASSIVSAASIYIVAKALGLIGSALKEMGGQSWQEIAKGLVTLAGALGIIALAMVGMTEALPGAAALLIVSSALSVLTPILVVLGNMSWESIAKGLVALAGAFAVIGLAGLLLTPVVPSLLALGAAIAIIGAGIALIGVGVLAFATGMTALAVSGAGAAVGITALGAAILGLLPLAAREIGIFVVTLATVIGDAGPAIVNALRKILLSLLKAIDEVAPKLIQTFFDILSKLLGKLKEDGPKFADEALTAFDGILKAVVKKSPAIIAKVVTLIINMLDALSKKANKFSAAAVTLLASFLQGIANNLHKVIKAGTNIVIAWINGITAADVRIIKAALHAIVTFVNGLANAIRANTGPLRKAGENLAGAIIDGMTLGLSSKAGKVLGEVKKLGGSLISGFAHTIDSNSPSREFYKLGQYIDQGLANGIIGGKAEVEKAWKNLHDSLKKVADDTATEIKDYTSKLKDLEKASKKDATAIKDMTAKLAEARKEHVASTAALHDLNDSFTKEKSQLKDLGHQYDQYTNKISKADDTLKAAIQTRDDYQKSLHDTLDVVPSIDTTTTLGDFEQSDREQLADIKKFAEVLQQLRKKYHLGDAMYDDLLQQGTAALPLAEQILAGGQGAVDTVDNLTSGINKAATKLSTTAAKSLYQAGVNAAQGVVDGLLKKQKAIADAMDVIAKEIVKSLKKELKIKSPSQVMADLGTLATKGLAAGMVKAIPSVKNAAGDIGDQAVSTLKKSISGLNDAFTMTTDLNPTITPVLDLSELRKNAPQISSMLSGQQITVDAALMKAQNVSAGIQLNKDAATAAETTSPVTAAPDVTFIQNNTSPKALSRIEIYRQTKNQLSLAKSKGVLTSNVA